MVNSRTINKHSLEYRVQFELFGKAIEASLVKVNSEDLATNGEICFSAHNRAWRNLLPEDRRHPACRNILEYYLQRNNCVTLDLSDSDIETKASELLAAASQGWPSQIQRCSVRDGRVSLFLNRMSVIGSAVKQTLEHGAHYGRQTGSGISVCIKINEDKDSDLTTARLRLVQQTSERLLRFQGFAITDHDADYQYLLTSKSEGKFDKPCQRCVCGVVKNRESNTKETTQTWETYVENKIKELSSLVESKSSGRDNDVRNIAEAVVTFELLCVKPSKPVFVRTDKDPDNAHSSSKEGSFVLYNASRINAILGKFKEEELLGKYPSLSDINNVDFALLNQEEEWELIYNFIVGFPEMIDNSVRCGTQLETCPQNLCLFLSRLSQKFSVYYRRIRILTEARDHLIPTMMARLHLLRALSVVVNNSLQILNIVPVGHM